MNTYYKKDDYMVGVCSDGTEFIFDIDAYDNIKDWNWFHHRDAIEGNRGKERLSLAKAVLGLYDRADPVIRIEKTFDYRKSNLYANNTYIDQGNYYDVVTIDGRAFMIDKDDYDKVKKFRWYLNTQNYPEAVKNGKLYRVHRYVMGLDEKFTYDRVVDHINRNTLDNRKCNLRIVSQAENVHNSAMKSNNTSGVTGAFWSPELGAWRAYRTVNGKKYKIGSYTTIDEAAVDLARFDYCMEHNIEFIPNPTHNKQPVSATGQKYIYNNNKGRGYIVNINKRQSKGYLGVYQDLDEAIRVRDDYLMTHNI